MTDEKRKTITSLTIQVKDGVTVRFTIAEAEELKNLLNDFFEKGRIVEDSECSDSKPILKLVQ